MSKLLQQKIANEAARIMMEDNVTSTEVARQKAMKRLGIQNKRLLPDNKAVETALLQYQRLFRSQRHVKLLNELRKTALNAMRMLEPFSPRLVGPVLKGTATENDAISLHLFTDTPEEVLFHLMDRRIPFREDEHQYQLTRNQRIFCPVCRFFAGSTEITLAIFPYNGLRQAPLSPIDDKPMKRATIATVESLIGG